MATTNNRQIADKIRLLREHGSKKRYYHDVLGFNFRMTDIAAAISIEQLKKLEKFNRRRIENAAYLTLKLEGVYGVIVPQIAPNVKHVFHQYAIKITPKFGKSRDEVIRALEQNGIGYGIYYPVPIHKQQLYRQLEYRDRLPVAEKIAKEVLSLPIHPGVTKRDLEKIARVFTEV